MSLLAPTSSPSRHHANPIPLEPEQEKALGSAALLELRSLAEESDPELRRRGLLSLASRFEARGQEEVASGIYELLPEDEKARSRKAAIEGKGDLGGVVEAQIRKLRGEVIQPGAILPMLVGSTVFGLTRAALLGRLLASPQASVWSRGLGARCLAGVGAFFAEVPAFTFSARALQGKHLSILSQQSLSRDLAQTAITLGLLKSFGNGAKWAAQSWRLSTAHFSNASAFLGLMAAQGLEAKLGLRPEMESPAAFTSAFASMLGMGAGARLGVSLLGARFVGFHRELELRSATAAPSSFRGDGRLLPSPLAANSAFRNPEPETAFGSSVAMSRGGVAGLKAKGEGPVRRLEKLIDDKCLTEAWRVFPEFKELKSQLRPGDFHRLAQKLRSRFRHPASNLRVHAFILLGYLIPHLSPAQRLRQLSPIDRGFRDSNAWVREVAVQTFDRNAPFWRHEDLEGRIPVLAKLYFDPERKVAEAAVRGLVRMTEFLSPSQRLAHLRSISGELLKSGDIDFPKILPMDRALRSLEPGERVEIVGMFEQSLPNFATNLFYIPFFADMIPRLAPENRLGRVLALEKFYGHRQLRVRTSAMTAVDNTLHLLPIAAQDGRVRRLESQLGSSTAEVRELAVTILGAIYRTEPRLARPARLERLATVLRDSDLRVRGSALEAHQKLAMTLSSEERLVMMDRLLSQWTNSKQGTRVPVGITLRNVYLEMKPEERQAWLQSIVGNRRGRALPPGLVAIFSDPQPTSPSGFNKPN